MAEKTRGSFLELTRYAFVGIVSNLAGYLVYLLITFLGVEPKMAMSLLFIIGVTIGFVGNRKWTFAYQGDTTRTARRFVVAYAIAYMLNFICMWIAVDRMGIPHYLVQGVSLVVISALLFMAQKYWIFAVNPAKANV